MDAALSLDKLSNDSKISAQLIFSARNFFIGIKQISGSFIAYLLAIIVSVPFILLLKYLRYRLNKKFNSNLQIDQSTYLNIRNNYDLSSKIISKFKPLLKISTSNLNIVIKLIFPSIKKLIIVIDKNNQLMENALLKLDQLDNNKPLLFNHIKEADLWSNRIKTYEYRM